MGVHPVVCPEAVPTLLIEPLQSLLVYILPSRLWVSRASLAEQNALGGESAVEGTAAAEVVDQIIAVAATVTDREVGVVVAATAGEAIVSPIDNAVGDVDVANGASIISSSCRCRCWMPLAECLKQRYSCCTCETMGG